MDSVAELNRDFSITGQLAFHAESNGLVVAEFRHAEASASLSLQGAHLFDWQVLGYPVLWLSEEAQFAQGKSIRGGIPVCWPWFGPHDGGSAMPAHGFARTGSWDVVGSGIEEDGSVRLSLRLQTTSANVMGWPHAAMVELTVWVGTELRMQLSTLNTGISEFVLGEALHTYFKISDIEAVSVTGLEGGEYWDTVGGVEKHWQTGAINFSAETDRVYINSVASCVIDDPGMRRRIHIDKAGSLSTVVWNPWADKAARMGDLGQPDGWRGMLCVESANAWDNCITLAPGETHAMSVVYRVELL